MLLAALDSVCCAECGFWKACMCDMHEMSSHTAALSQTQSMAVVCLGFGCFATGQPC